MSGVLLLLCSFALAHAEPNQVKSQPLYCITCAAQEVTCISTAVNQCKDQHACDTIMSAASCVTCIGTANCGSDPACADCPTNQLESIVKVKKLVAAGSTEDKEAACCYPFLLLNTPMLRAGVALFTLCWRAEGWRASCIMHQRPRLLGELVCKLYLYIDSFD